MKPGILALMLMTVAAVAADKKTADKDTNPTPATATAKVKEIVIPAGAVETEPYTYRYTDSQGKKWIYRKTPFGVSRIEDRPVTTEAARRALQEKASLIELTRAVEDGDSVRFERATPFGPMKWQRKKKELNEVESAVWNRDSKKSGTPESASKD